MQGTISNRERARPIPFVNYISTRRTKIVEIIAGIFILLFVYTALSKLYELVRFEEVLKRSPLVKYYASVAAWLVPILELLISTFLFIPRTRGLGLYAAFIIMCIFTIYLGYMIISTPNLPCSCGGVISQLSWKGHLVLNILLSAIAFWGIILNRAPSKK